MDGPRGERREAKRGPTEEEMTLSVQGSAVLEQPPPVESEEETFRIHTARFGTLEVPVTQRFCFASGMPGFPGPLEMALFPNPGGGVFEWLHSTVDTVLGFPVLVPDADLWDLIAEPLAGSCEGYGWAADDALDVRLIVTIPAGAPGSATLNLRAPIVLNFTQRRGAQPILTDDTIPLRMPLFPAAS